MSNCIDGIKVYLRPISIDDTESIIKWRNNNKVRHNFIYQKKFDKDTHLRWLEEYVDTGKVIQYIIVDKVSNNSIGSVYYRDIDYINKKAEYGIFIGNDNYRGIGIGTEVAKIFIKYGFEILKLKSIYLRVFEDNYGAIKSYFKAGFKKNGKYEDMYLNGENRKIVFMDIQNY